MGSHQEQYHYSHLRIYQLQNIGILKAKQIYTKLTIRPDIWLLRNSQYYQISVRFRIFLNLTLINVLAQ